MISAYFIELESKMKIYETDYIRKLCRDYRGWDDISNRKKLIEIARGRNDGTIDIIGENGADRDEAISALVNAIGGPW